MIHAYDNLKAMYPKGYNLGLCCGLYPFSHSCPLTLMENVRGSSGASCPSGSNMRMNSACVAN